MLCDKTKQYTVDILIPHDRAIILHAFLAPTVVGGRRPFRLKFALKVTHPLPKNTDFDRFLLIASQPYEIAKKFNYDE